MGRTIGAKNFTAFNKRNSIETSTSKEVRHLANIKGSPLQEFSALLKHQGNFLGWVDSRHELVVEQKGKIDLLNGKIVGKGPKGAKDGTFVKYRWYAEQLILLEAINAFETFYKKTFVALSTPSTWKRARKAQFPRIRRQTNSGP